jgi:hypothetical protein
MVARKMKWMDEAVVERAEFVERTVKELCELLRAGRGYAEVSEHIQRAQGALQSIRATLWQRELVRAVRRHERRAA